MNSPGITSDIAHQHSASNSTTHSQPNSPIGHLNQGTGTESRTVGLMLRPTENLVPLLEQNNDDRQMHQSSESRVPQLKQMASDKLMEQFLGQPNSYKKVNEEIDTAFIQSLDPGDTRIAELALKSPSFHKQVENAYGTPDNFQSTVRAFSIMEDIKSGRASDDSADANILRGIVQRNMPWADEATLIRSLNRAIDNMQFGSVNSLNDQIRTARAGKEELKGVNVVGYLNELVEIVNENPTNPLLEKIVDNVLDHFRHDNTTVLETPLNELREWKRL